MLIRIRFDFENIVNSVTINHSPVLKTNVVYLISNSSRDVIHLSDLNRPKFISQNKTSLILITLRMRTSFEYIIKASNDKNKKLVVSIK